MKLTFDEGHSEKLKKIAQYYGIAKELLLFAEEIGTEKRTIIQAIKELRDAFDHLSRVLALKFEVRQLEKGQSQNDYISLSLDKTLGHIYRSYYESLDVISIDFRNKIINELKDFSNETIKEVLPNYYTEIRPSIEDINIKIAELRAEKDIGSPESENIEEYMDIVKQLQTYYNTVIGRKTALIEYENKQKKEQTKTYLWGIFSGIVITIIGGVIIHLIFF